MSGVRDTVHNGSHRVDESGYFEWWYLQLAASGLRINIVLHETDIFGESRDPYLSLSLREDGGQPEYYRLRLADAGVSIARESRRLGVGRLLQEEDESLALSLGFEGLELAGTITRLAGPAVINGGVLHDNRTTGARSHWVANIPHGVFEATLVRRGVRTRLRGLAYQDHQWGTLPIQDFVTDWVWGHFSNDETALTFFRILTRDGTVVERCVLAGQKQLIRAETVSADHLAELEASPRPDQSSRQAVVRSGSCPGVELSLDFEPQRIMRARVGEDHGSFNASYVRWAADARQQTEGGLATLGGVTEYLRIRR